MEISTRGGEDLPQNIILNVVNVVLNKKRERF